MLPGAVAGGPAAQRSDDVVGGKGRAVAELEPIAQFEGPGFLVVRGPPFRHHLRLGIEIGVDAKQGVVEHGAVVGAHVGRGPDRVEHGEVPVHHGADGFGGGGCGLGRQAAGRRHRGGRREAGFEEAAARGSGAAGHGGFSLGWAEAQAASGHACNAAGCTDPSAINARVRNLGKGMSTPGKSGLFPGQQCHPVHSGSRRWTDFGQGWARECGPARGLSLHLPLR